MRKILLQRKVSEPEDIPHLIKFVQQWGGGLEAGFLHDLSDFYKAFVQTGRIVPGPCADTLLCSA